MPLSEEEQRILHEMEQKLYEHDRGFVDRVRAPRTGSHRSVRLSVIIFVVGFLLIVITFRQSLLLASAGFLLMLRSMLAFERGARQARTGRSEPGAEQVPANAHSRVRMLADEVSMIGRRFRSRFSQHR